MDELIDSLCDDGGIPIRTTVAGARAEGDDQRRPRLRGEGPNNERHRGRGQRPRDDDDDVSSRSGFGRGDAPEHSSIELKDATSEPEVGHREAAVAEPVPVAHGLSVPQTTTRVPNRSRR